MQDGVVDGCERSCARTLLLEELVLTAALRPLGRRKDAAGGDDEDMTVGKLLLEFTGETEKMSVGMIQDRAERKSIPLLNLVPAREERDGHEDDDGFSAVANFDLKAD
jgi:hypothetical protein